MDNRRKVPPKPNCIMHIESEFIIKFQPLKFKNIYSLNNFVLFILLGFPNKTIKKNIQFDSFIQ